MRSKRGRGRPVSKEFLGRCVIEVRLGPMHRLLAREADAEMLPMTDVVRREIGRYLMSRGHDVDQRILDPEPVRRRLVAALLEAEQQRRERRTTA